VFEKYAAVAIAVKSQHAYNRTLHWQKRDDADVERIIETRMKKGEVSEAEANCLGDWALARGAELCAKHNLPLKIHTGYAAGNRTMQLDRMRALHLSPLLAQYPDTRFVLMHNSYPHDHEVAALAKHYPNVWVDMCWAWSIDPHSATQFIRRMIHAVPANKLFAFGGDSFVPAASVGYAFQARAGLTRALQAEVDAGDLSEKQAISLAQRFMQSNQRACFDLEGTRAAIHASSLS
jgi:predicted TIM-barrel fold metal-dependent hydrolase